MSPAQTRVVEDVRRRLIEVAGRASQDLGLGRITGQLMALVYLSPEECSLDAMVSDLGLSKASVSIAARRLEALGLLRRTWRKGQRRHYYQAAGNLGAALRQGALAMIRTKLRAIDLELGDAERLLGGIPSAQTDGEARFLRKRLTRARRLRKRASGILESPLLRLLGR
ncbi:MAG: hypothetical protein FJ279_04745 [Planctomycetes bacterium]|nr:hypothetical protein [Verrucomicrobiota bacterium]MBM4044401.1 hypothetical protein [Planctomycetota bacterium]